MLIQNSNTTSRHRYPINGERKLINGLFTRLALIPRPIDQACVTATELFINPAIWWSNNKLNKHTSVSNCIDGR